jgi:DNA-binding NtrC family response regulator
VGRAGRVLVVDDEVSARATLADLLRDEGYQVEMAADAFKAIGKYEAFTPHVVVTDLHMPGMDGVELVQRLRAGDAPPAVIVMTAFGAVESAVEAMRAGAADYLTKPLDFEQLLRVLDRVLEHHRRRAELRAPTPRGAPGKLVSAVPAMQRIHETIERAAPSAASVLITGEAGTGKELLARSIHQASPRARRPFVKLCCAGLAEATLETELFGYERGGDGAGAGAGAASTQVKDGELVHAGGGTIFLDDVGALTPALQIKLLRFLEDHEIARVGGRGAIRVDVRVIAATQRDLGAEVAAGRFREDLYYRLRVVAITVPPLRERTQDLPALARAFVHKYAAANGTLIDGITPEALEVLAAYDWPGNVRELEHAVESAVVLTRSGPIEATALPPAIRAGHGSGGHTGPPRIPGSTMADIERYAILETMKATGGSTSKAAEILGISTRTVQYRLHQYHEAQRSQQDVVRKPR